MKPDSREYLESRTGPSSGQASAKLLLRRPTLYACHSGAVFGNTMTIRNTIAVWGWLICSAFLFGCAVMSWLLLNERVPDGTSPVLMGAFNLALWAVGMFAAHIFFAKPVTILRCHANGFTVD